MQLEYSGTIPMPVGEAWAVLSDLEQVAACLPGVRLDQIKVDVVAGTVTVPLGPLRLTYRGEAAFIERDPVARRVVIEAAGRDSHGEQAASARTTVQLRDSGAETQVTASSEVSVRGMSAPVGFAVREFGTGLLREFVGRLGTPRARPEAEGAPPIPSPRPRPVRDAEAQAQPVTQRGHATASSDDRVYPVPPPGAGAELPVVVRAVGPYAGTLAVGVLIGWLLGRRHR